MEHSGNRTRFCPALTLLEMVIAMAILAMIGAVLVPQLRAISNGWDSKAGNAEALQNGRVLMEHISRNLSKATKITAVSNPSTVNGYIEFIDNDANSVRYDINNTTNYIEFGHVDNLSDLGGPVSQLQFTCYDAYNFETPVSDVNTIRCVKIETTLTNSADMGRDMTFATRAYLRCNNLPSAGDISKMADPWLEYDIDNGQYPNLVHMSGTNYLCAYVGDRYDGWVCILTVNTGDWSVGTAGYFEFDTRDGQTPVLANIDDTHFLCVYVGVQSDGFACILEHTPPNTINDLYSLEFYNADLAAPSLCQIDTTHYLCAYSDMETGYTVSSVILTVNTGDWSISSGTSISFAGSYSSGPALAKIDDTHYLCAYKGRTVSDHGAAVVLTVNQSDWTISPGTHFDFYGEAASAPQLAKIDDEHYLCTYWASNNGLATILTVDPADWTVTKDLGPDFYMDSMTSTYHQLSQIDGSNFLCAYPGLATGRAVVLTVDTGNWSISEKTPVTFETSSCYQTALCKVDAAHYLCAYAGSGSDGFAGILELDAAILP